MNTDHCLLVSKMQVKLKIPKKNRKRKIANLDKLNEENIKNVFNLELRNTFASLRNEIAEQNPEHNIDTEWEILKTCINHATEVAVPKKERKRRQEWMTDDILDLMERRRECKKDIESY